LTTPQTEERSAARAILPKRGKKGADEHYYWNSLRRAASFSILERVGGRKERVGERGSKKG